jgi:hypothetical protein
VAHPLTLPSPRSRGERDVARNHPGFVRSTSAAFERAAKPLPRTWLW